MIFVRFLYDCSEILENPDTMTSRSGPLFKKVPHFILIQFSLDVHAIHPPSRLSELTGKSTTKVT